MAIEGRTYLRMQDPARLRPPSRTAASVEIEPVTEAQRPLLRSLYDRTAATYNWPEWDKWTERIDDPTRRFYFLKSEAEPVGIARFTLHSQRAVEIVTFGLLSEYIGKGLGGEALAQVTREAWRLADASGSVVWLYTSAGDHPHALSNYLARGFEVSEPAE